MLVLAMITCLVEHDSDDTNYNNNNNHMLADDALLLEPFWKHLYLK